MRKMPVCYQHGMAFFGVVLGIVSGLAQNLSAEQTNNSTNPPLQVVAALLATTNVAWGAESKATNAITGADHAEFVFCFTNLSAMPLTVINVHTSCGCTTAQLPALPWTVPARTNGQIGVRVNLAGKSGTVTKAVTVGTDQGTKMLTVKIIIQPPPTPFVAEAVRLQNMQVSQTNRQAVFYGDCASCHVKAVEGRYAKQLYDALCVVCHEAEHRASMVPDLHQLTVPTDENFWRTWVSYGRPGSLMPAFAKTETGPLTDMQIVSLAAYLNAAMPSHVTNSIQ